MADRTFAAMPPQVAEFPVASASTRGADSGGMPLSANTASIALSHDRLRNSKEIGESSSMIPHVRPPPIDDMFYSLELDEEASAYLQRTQTTGAEEEKKGNETELATLRRNEKEEPAGLQYLFDVINQRSAPEKARELKQIVQKLRRSRSKWAHEYRIGQEQLYEALEKVLIELKTATDYSLPFINKVDRREVPDYYIIIKKPMDLTQMTKKLHALQYMSKDDFADDLYLIWSNCLTYNTHPENPFRKKAIVMKKRTTELLKKVPDIKIEVKAPDDPDTESDDEHEEKPGDEGKPVLGSRGFPLAGHAEVGSRGGKFRKADPLNLEKTSEQVQLESLFDDDNDGPTAIVPERIDRTDRSVSSKSIAAGELPDEPVTPRSGMDLKDEIQNARQQTPQADDRAPSPEHHYFDDEKDEQTLRWKQETFKLRSSTLSDLDRQFEKPFADRPAIVRRPEDFHLLDFSFSNYLARASGQQTLRGPTEEQTPKVELAAKAFLPEIFSPYTGLPHISASSKSPFSLRLTKEERPSKLRKTIMRSINSLQSVKEHHAKIIAKVTNSVVDAKADRKWDSGPAWFNQTCSSPDLLTAESIMRQITAQLLAHAGFDSAHQSTVSILTEIGIQYFQNLGKTLKLYVDKFSLTIAPEKLLLMSLQANGIDSAERLDQYVRFDILRYGLKLHDLRRRLEAASKALDETLEDKDNTDINFDEVDNNIMSGNFFEEMGIDLLNLQDLGLDFTSIPTELWNKKSDNPIRIRRNIVAKLMDEGTEAVPVQKLKPAKPWSPVDPSQVIGLLRPFYEVRQADDNMIEDDDKPKSKFHKSKALIRVAQSGRKKPAAESRPPKAIDPAKAAEKAAKEAAKRKREAERLEKAERGKMKKRRV
ncbi:hypothetical protein DFJ73DRAFT_833617 [Zopfochytrium polystomum]|nr:hypothetical protein DFJ73DRAFT_833617 [Zopfochytrium polystomum]